MFWSDPFDYDGSIQACQQRWGVTPRPGWATTEWGGRRIGAASNIVFSNGLLDPWHGGGVLVDVSDSLPAVIIPEVRAYWHMDTVHTVYWQKGEGAGPREGEVR